jgi:hypothetical protein
MTLQEITEVAQQVANENGISIAVVNSPVDQDEFANDPYGYCPLSSVNILYPCREKIECICEPQP